MKDRRIMKARPRVAAAVTVEPAVLAATATATSVFEMGWRTVIC